MHTQDHSLPGSPTSKGHPPFSTTSSVEPFTRNPAALGSRESHVEKTEHRSSREPARVRSPLAPASSAEPQRSTSVGKLATPAKHGPSNRAGNVSVFIDREPDHESPASTPPLGPKRQSGGRSIAFAALAFGILILHHISQNPQGPWDARLLDKLHPHDWIYYLKCSFAGSLACSSHVLLIPLDVVKVNMQYDPKKYHSFRQSVSLVIKEHGWGTSGLLKGANALIVSYGKQGVVKFGLYEFLKDAFMNYFGESFSMHWTGLIFLLASSIAEAYADIALCPCEMLKVKIQTSPPGSFPTAFWPALKRFYRERAENGFPFGSIEAVWSRQIPYTMAKFFVFERLVQYIYAHVLTQPKETYDPSTQLLVTVVSGFLTGLCAAACSHVPDTLFSIRARAENVEKSYAALIAEHGLWRLATTGLVVRMIIVGFLTAIQWWTYDTCKTLIGLTTTSTLFRTPAPAG
ncbi:Mitochondrial phosphate carrier protein 2 [Diplonema papillatum]|nr:Mitochondrial phosphate carrier protein 2 [Diplonema papillatum]